MWEPILWFRIKPVPLYPPQNYFPSYLKREMAKAGECLRRGVTGRLFFKPGREEAQDNAE
jgi:hypothetical protein